MTFYPTERAAEKVAMSEVERWGTTMFVYQDYDQARADEPSWVVAVRPPGYGPFTVHRVHRAGGRFGS